MTKQNLTDITILLDASTSMFQDREKTRNAINEFIRGQQATPGECNITLYTFSAPSMIYGKHDIINTNTWLNSIWEGLNINCIKELLEIQYRPSGNTALYDATGIVIKRTGERFSKLPEHERPSKVLFVTMTDGEENSSREYKLPQLKEMIQHQSNVYSWNFLFLGADFNTNEQTESLGLEVKTSSMNFSKQDMMKSYKGLSRAVSEYRSGSASKTSAGFADLAKTYADQESN